MRTDLEKRINKLRIARNKAIELSEYIDNNELELLQSENSIDLDSAIHYDVFKTIDKEYNRLLRKQESIDANNLLK